MEDELFKVLYSIVLDEDKRRPRRKRVVFSDAVILLVACWATLHDRPMCWACRKKNWHGELPWLEVPSPSTLSERLRTLSLQLLMEQVFYRMLAVVAICGFCLCRRIDSKPLPVGMYSKDRDARRGHVADGFTAKGYKLFACWGKSPTAPEALTLGPMNCSDQAGAMQLIQRLQHLYGPDPGQIGGYLLADSTHDVNVLHDHSGGCGLQLLTPRKQPNTGLGHCKHSPYRLRSIELMEGPADRICFALSPAARSFGPSLYRQRGQIERDLGNAVSFGGGLQPLPAWVRRPHRVVLWAILKLIINSLRICRNQGLTP